MDFSCWIHVNFLKLFASFSKVLRAYFGESTAIWCPPVLSWLINTIKFMKYISYSYIISIINHRIYLVICTNIAKNRGRHLVGTGTTGTTPRFLRSYDPAFFNTVEGEMCGWAHRWSSHGGSTERSVDIWVCLKIWYIPN